MIYQVQTGAVILDGDTLAVVRELVWIGQHWRRTNGHSPSVEYARLLAALSRVGQPDVPEEAGEHPQYMTTKAAAEALGCSARNAQRLAPRLGGRRVGGQWLLDTRSVAEHIDGRNLG